MKETKEQKQKGITLISLVITIILLLILATVAISLAVDSDGLFSKAGQAANAWNTSVAEEGTELENLMLMANSVGGTTTQSTLPEGWEEEIVIATVEEGDRIVPIPAGYVVSKVETEDTISEGLVIYKQEEGAQIDWENEKVTIGETTTILQETLNQYVWIPVDGINDMVMCSVCGGNSRNLIYDDTTKTLTCTSTHEEGKTPILVGKLYIARNEDIGMNKSTDSNGNNIYIIDYFMDFTQNNQEYPEDNTGYREPAIVTGDEPTLLTQMQGDFNDMAKSVAKYGGFYISRYEIGANGDSKKGQAVLSNTDSNNWYTLQSTLRKTGTSTTSQMIWGSQYDQVMKYLAEDTTNEPYNGHANRNLSSLPAVSGNNPLDKMMNIYDLEGNYGEWTADVYNTTGRVGRGGVYINMSSIIYPASFRGGSAPTNTSGSISTRSTLYLVLDTGSGE